MLLHGLGLTGGREEGGDILTQTTLGPVTREKNGRTVGIGTGRKVFVKDSRRVESLWPPCPHNVTALYKNGSSHASAPPSRSLGETTRAAAPVRALEGEAVTSPPQVQVVGRTDQARGLPPCAHALSSGPS